MSMSDWLKRNVDPLLIAKKRVLMVEGEDDKRVHEVWLDKLAGGRGSGRTPNVVAPGQKGQIVRYLKLRPDAVTRGMLFGIVDRDDWDPAETARQLAETPGLRVNPARHTLESYFCNLDDLQSALSDSSLLQGPATGKAIAKIAKAEIAGWVNHWALWTTLERLKNRMADAAYPDAFHTDLALPPDVKIKAKLIEWSGMIDVDRVMRDFRRLRKNSLKADLLEQLGSCIHAKKVFPKYVVELNKLKSEIKSDEWMPKLAEWMPSVPPDIAAILEPLLAP